MRVLIVEDNAFNAFCLRRIVESVMTSVSVTIVNNSVAALSLIQNYHPDMVIIDGDLGAASADPAYCNGPELIRILLQKYSHLPLIAWTDSDDMRQEFARVFKSYSIPVNEFNSWPKVVSKDRILNTLAYYFDGYTNTGNNFPRQSLGYY